MADLYRKALESERKSLWAHCRLRGLAKDTPERQRIAQIDEALKDHAAKQEAGASKQPAKAPARPAAKRPTPKKPA